MTLADSASSTYDALGISRTELGEIVRRALAEDLGKGDLTTRLTIPEGQRACGTFFSKQSLVVAGLPVAAEVFRTLEEACACVEQAAEGEEVPPGKPLARVEGRAATLLSGERVALNFLQRLSGIATLTREFKKQIEGLKTELLDTRKTAPGLRSLEKYAVRMGGGHNHRLRLDDGILIKNNHLILGGGIRATVERARGQRPAGIPVEVEVRSVGELEEAIDAGADLVLLDNMTPDVVVQCVERAAGRARLEVSGGINRANLRAYAETGVDRISVGALTHSAGAVDINFLIEPL